MDIGGAGGELRSLPFPEGMTDFSIISIMQRKHDVPKDMHQLHIKISTEKKGYKRFMRLDLIEANLSKFCRLSRFQRIVLVDSEVCLETLWNAICS